MAHPFRMEVRRSENFGGDHVPNMDECAGIGEATSGALPTTGGRERAQPIAFPPFLSVLLEARLRPEAQRRRTRRRSPPRQFRFFSLGALTRLQMASCPVLTGRAAISPAWA